jgi:hypothetical protein
MIPPHASDEHSLESGEHMDSIASGSSRHHTPRVGIVALDSPIARVLEHNEHAEVEVPVGFVTNPRTWPWPVEFRAARGVDNDAALHGSDGMHASVEHAITALDGRCDLIVGNCGFFWRASDSCNGTSVTPVLLSSLDIVDVAVRMTSAPVGVLTYSQPDCEEMLKSHPDAHRLRIIGYSDLPAWQALRPTDWVQRREWSVKALKEQFIERTERELASGHLVDARVILLECTVMPQFRKDLRRLTAMPVFDILTLARSMLD